MEPTNRDFVRRMFDEVSREFEQMDQMMEEMFRTGRSTAPGVTTFGPYVYGYTMTVGPDGKPQINEFSNLRPSGTSQAPALGTREPLVDTVLDSKKNTVRIAAEMPGVTKEDVKVSATEQVVTISAERSER
jgi:HSP20 family protein